MRLARHHDMSISYEHSSCGHKAGGAAYLSLTVAFSFEMTCLNIIFVQKPTILFVGGIYQKKGAPS